MQASNLNDEEDCKARAKEKGCKWTGSECKCKNSNEKNPPVRPFVDNSVQGVTSGTPQLTQAPPPDSTTTGTADGDSSTGTDGGMGGGGRESPDNSIGLPTASAGEPLDEEDSTANTEKTADNSALKLSRSSGFSSGGGGRYSGRRRRGGGENEESSIPGLGGGGFSGYGGGGGFGEDDSTTAGLGLSKKKLKELEKKQGAKRGTAGKMLGSSHQNIFERISKRFQSLCQTKINCN